ncbi:TPA: hypothetical protein ACPJZT_004590 [Vibrio alginolyticus]
MITAQWFRLGGLRCSPLNAALEVLNMKHTFFEPSDTALKYRRNLMFASIMGILHFGYTSLSNLKVFNVTIPDELINWGLPACVLWFGFNYFYLLSTELLQWKVQFLIPKGDIVTDNGTVKIVDKGWQKFSITNEIVNLTEEHYSLKTEFSTSGKVTKLDKGAIAEQRLIDAFKKHLEQFKSGIRHDLERISLFQNSISCYTRANKIKLYVLDYGVPLIMLIFSVGLFIKQHF